MPCPTKRLSTRAGRRPLELRNDLEGQADTRPRLRDDEGVGAGARAWRPAVPLRPATGPVGGRKNVPLSRSQGPGSSAGPLPSARDGEVREARARGRRVRWLRPSGLGGATLRGSTRPARSPRPRSPTQSVWLSKVAVARGGTVWEDPIGDRSDHRDTPSGKCGRDVVAPDERGGDSPYARFSAETPRYERSRPANGGVRSDGTGSITTSSGGPAPTDAPGWLGNLGRGGSGGRHGASGEPRPTASRLPRR